MSNATDDDDDDFQMIGADWICKRWSIHRRTLTRICAGDPTFPPMLVLPGGLQRWNKAAVLKWMQSRTKKKDD